MCLLHSMILTGDRLLTSTILKHNCSTFFTAIFEPMVFHHKISRLEILYSLITIAGLLCIFSFDACYRYGIMIGVAAAAVAAIYAVFNKKGSADVHGRTSLFYQMAGGVVVLSAIMPIYLLSLQRYYAIPPFPNSGLVTTQHPLPENVRSQC